MSPRKRSDEETRELRSSLLAHARRVVARDGAAALTMRALATEAGCAVGLPYKVFAHREELITELLVYELERLLNDLHGWVRSAGQGTVAQNLGQYAELLHNSPAIALGGEIAHDQVANEAVTAAAITRRFGDTLQSTIADYLTAEQQLGRVRESVDATGFGFLIAGAVHNLLIAPPAYPHPTIEQLKQLLTDVARSLIPDRGQS